MNKIVSSFFVLILSLAFISNANADCTSAYGKLIAKKIKNAKKTKIIGWSATGAMGGVGGAAGLSSFAAVYGANVGIIFGLQVGVVVALPAISTMIIITQANKVRLKSLVEAQQVIVASTKDDAQATDIEALVKLLKGLKKTHPNLTLELLKNEIAALNSQNFFCDGSLSNNLPGIGKIKKHLKTSL